MFFKKLIADATPKAAALKQSTSNVGSNIAHNRVVSAAGRVAYSGLVNTVGIGIVLATPAVNKTRDLASKAMSYVAAVATEPKK